MAKGGRWISGRLAGGEPPYGNYGAAFERAPVVNPEPIVDGGGHRDVGKEKLACAVEAGLGMEAGLWQGQGHCGPCPDRRLEAGAALKLETGRNVQSQDGQSGRGGSKLRDPASGGTGLAVAEQRVDDEIRRPQSLVEAPLHLEAASAQQFVLLAWNGRECFRGDSETDVDGGAGGPESARRDQPTSAIAAGAAENHDAAAGKVPAE